MGDFNPTFRLLRRSLRSLVPTMRVRHFAGVDIGATSAKLGLVEKNDAGYDVQETSRFDTGSEITAKGLVDAISRGVSALAASGAVSIDSVGVGVPGPVDFAGQQVVALPNLPNVDVEELSALLRDAVSARVVVDNDANLHGLGELAQTTTRPDMRMLTLTVGTGLGSSLCAGDHLVRGGIGTWPELGHVPVAIDDRAPRPCGCGSGRNHLESFVSSRGIVTSAREDGCKKSLSTPEALFTAAVAGDAIVIDSLRASGEIFGQGLALAVDCLGVSDIVVGGGCAPLFRWLEPGILQGLGEYAAFSTVSAKVQIRKSEAKSPALIGAAALVMSVD